jgi:glycogen synthase
MQLCEEVTDGLVARGNDVAVLTSTRCDGSELSRSYPVHRLLTLDPDWSIGKSAAWQFFVGRKRREAEAVAHLQRVVADFQPDLLFVWHAIGLSRVMLQAAEALSQPTVYYLAGYLPELPDEHVKFWQVPPVHWTAKLVKQPLALVALAMIHREGKPVRLQYKHVICVSEYVRQRLVDQDLIPEDSVVIHNGVDLKRFSANNRSSTPSVLNCLVAGRINAEKGIHTVIDAFYRLSQTPQASHFKLRILGDGPANYVEAMRQNVDSYGLQDMVTFAPPVPRTQMPEVLARHHVMILPSEYAEPIARSMQEGMAMGLLIVGTITGGSGELLVHEETGLVFEAGNAKELADQLARVVSDPTLASRLALAGQQAVRERFNIDCTIAEIEDYLLDLLAD